jgi:hypothetical protein
VPLGTPANRELRLARQSLHQNFIEPLWQSAAELKAYQKRLEKRPWMRQDIEKKARDRVYRFLSEKLNLTSEDCHVGRFDLLTCERAAEIFRNLTYSMIRNHYEVKKKAARWEARTIVSERE